MTVQNSFTSWQTYPMEPDPKKCAPIAGSWWTYLRTHWGGQHLGCYVRRSVVGGSSLSSHGSGAAMDWRYQSPGPGRSVMLNETMPFLLDNSLELGIQAIHDYAGKRIWRPPGCSGRATAPSPECGWKPSSGGQMNSANTWLHLEVVPSRWSDTRTVEQMLGEPTTPPAPQPSGVYEVPNSYRSDVKQGSTGKMAKMCQQQINLIAGQGIVEDGYFGSQSVAALKNVQTVLGVPVDGWCGSVTWQAFEDGIRSQANAGDWD